MARTTARTHARDAAAKRQESANAARSEYDAEELETLTRLDLAQHRRDEAVKNLAAAEHDMAVELERLFDMGNSLERILILSGEVDKETIKRLRKMVSETHASNPDTKKAANPGSRRNGALRRVQVNEVMVPVPHPE